MNNRVLVPVDGSENAWKAFEFAINEHNDDTLVVLYVVNPLKGEYELTGAKKRAKKRSKQIEQEVHDRVAEHNNSVDLQYVTREGQPQEEILAYIDESNIDQVVIGTRGLSGIKRILMGSVTETIVRKASVPVNVI